MLYIDTHAHLDGEEFASDLDEVITRAKAVGVGKIFIPGINLSSVDSVLSVCERYPDYCYPMLGLHPEDVRSNWQEVLTQLKSFLQNPSSKIIAIGEIGLDFYWSREYEQEQLLAFEQQVRWSIELHLPLMIHCRKAQNEMVYILKKYKDELCGGVFHCFTGNEIEARELLQFRNFALGIGGVLTFKKSNLPATLNHPASPVPLDRIVLETDSPYMAPVPHRGQRNEPAFVLEVLLKLSEVYQVSPEEVASITTATASHLFGLS